MLSTFAKDPSSSLVLILYYFIFKLASVLFWKVVLSLNNSINHEKKFGNYSFT